MKPQPSFAVAFPVIGEPTLTFVVPEGPPEAVALPLPPPISL